MNDVEDGRKRLTLENWLEPDKASTLLVTVDKATGEVRELLESDWARSFLAVSLDIAIPTQVRQMFNGARGALLYGFFYYPLYALGEDQLYRVGDAAVLHRYLLAGGAMKEVQRRRACGETGTEMREEAPSFDKRIRWLAGHGVLSKQEEEWWDCQREIRNLTTHSKLSHLGPPSQALFELRSHAHHIDALFGQPFTSPGAVGGAGE